MDQASGEDLNPRANRLLVGGEVRDEGTARNPDRPSNLAPVVLEDDRGTGRGTTRITSPEKWELKQLIAAGELTMIIELEYGKYACEMVFSLQVCVQL